MSAETTVDKVINDGIARANEAQDKAIAYGDQAQTAAGGSLSLTTPGVVAPVIPTPPFPPDLNGATEFTISYDQAFADYSAEFNAQWNNFLNTFFPEVDGCIAENVDEWICNTIQNGGTGIPAAVEQAMFDRAVSREQRMISSKHNDIMSDWAGRGFSLPGGVVQNMLDAQSDEMSDKLSTISRDVLIKNKEIEIENIRLAVAQGVQLRLGAIQAAIGYVSAWFLVPKTAIDKAASLATARISFYQAISAYYNALAVKYQIQAKYAELNIFAQTETNKAVAIYSSENTKARVSAAVGSATALGHVAAAAFGANNTLANIGNVTLNTKKAA